MKDVKQNTTRGFFIFADDATALGTGLAGLSISSQLSKNGAAFSAVSPTVTDRGDGVYWVGPIAAHRDTLGEAAWKFSATGAVIGPRFENVVAYDAQQVAVGASTHGAPDLSNLDAPVSSRSSHGPPDLSNLDAPVSSRSSHGAPDLSNLDATVSSRSSHPAPDLSNLDATISSRMPAGNVTVGDIVAAALTKFVTEATGETSATAGSVADLAKGSGGSGGSGDASLAKQNEILSLLESTPVNVISNVNSGGALTIYLGDDDTGDNAISIPHDGGTALRDLLQDADSVIFGAGTGDAANQITGTVNPADVTDEVIPVEIPSANKAGALASPDYTYHVKAIKDSAENVKVEGSLTLNSERATP